MDAETRVRLTKYVNSQRTEAVDPEEEALREWLKSIDFLWESIGKKIDGDPEQEKRYDAYTRLFQGVPIALLEKATIRAISNNGKYQVIPAPGAIWEALRKILEIRDNEDVIEAIENWTVISLDRCFVKFGD